MKQKKSKKSSTVGRRTGVDIVDFNKTLKLNEDGFESFGDYWQDSSSSRDGSPTYMNSSPVNSNVKRISSFVKNITDLKKESISFINPPKSPFLHKESHVESPYPHLVENKLPRSRKPYTKGRRTGADLIAGKDINVNENIEDFKGYWTSTQSDFNTDVNSTNTGKVSIPGGSRSCSSDFNSDESSKTIYNCSSTNLRKEKSFVEVAHADSTFSPDSSNLNPSINSTITNKTLTFKAPPNSDLIENSEVTSTSVDGNKFKGCCNKTPTAVRRRSPRKSPLPKSDVRDTLQGTFVKKLPISEASQNSVIDCESSNPDEEKENNNDETTNTPGDKKLVIRLTKITVFENNQRISDKDIFYQRDETDNMSSSHVENDETASKFQTSKQKVNLFTSRNRDKSDSISFTSQVGKQRKINSSVVENDKICSLASNGTFSQDEAEENTNRKTKYCATQKKEMTRTQISINNKSSKNSPVALRSNRISRTPKSTEPKSRGRKRKRNLSTSRKRDETDCLSSSDIKNWDVESTNEETKHKKQDISLRNMASRNSPVIVHLSQIARTPKSAEYKSLKGKSKHDSSTSRKRNEIDRETMHLSQNKTIDETASKVLPKTNKSSQREKKSKKRKFPSSSATLSDNIETESSQMPALRRSKREKVAPLESWRLERRVFGYKNGEVVKISYEEGFPIDKPNIDVFKKHKSETKKKKPEKKNLKLNDNSVNMELVQSNIEKVSCINPHTGEEELVYLHRPYQTLLWSVPPSQDQKDPSYTLSKCQSGELISFGYIDIGVKKKKDKQYSPTDNITLMVTQGKIKVSINDKELNLTEKDTITVPSGNGYSIKNTGKIPALLYFCAFKVPFFDYQFGEPSETA